jgi:hypothetical protein
MSVPCRALASASCHGLGEAVAPEREHGVDARARHLVLLGRQQLHVRDGADRRARIVHDRDRHEHRRQDLIASSPPSTRAVAVRVVGLDVLPLNQTMFSFGAFVFTAFEKAYSSIWSSRGVKIWTGVGGRRVAALEDPTARR